MSKYANNCLQNKAKRQETNRFLSFFHKKFKGRSELVSRVLYTLVWQSSIFTTSHLIVQAVALPPHTSDGPSAHSECKVLHRIGFTANLCYHRSGWALTPPFHPYRHGDGGLFLLHFPEGRPWRMLSVILPCDARTFLTIIPFGDISRDCPIHSVNIIPETSR